MKYSGYEPETRISFKHHLLDGGQARSMPASEVTRICRLYGVDASTMLACLRDQVRAASMRAAAHDATPPRPQIATLAGLPANWQQDHFWQAILPPNLQRQR